MTTRSKLFRRTGPFTHEAIFLVMVEQVNLLRKRSGYPELSVQEFMDLVANHISHLEPYPPPRR